MEFRLLRFETTALETRCAKKIIMTTRYSETVLLTVSGRVALFLNVKNRSFGNYPSARRRGEKEIQTPLKARLWKTGVVQWELGWAFWFSIPVLPTAQHPLDSRWVKLVRFTRCKRILTFTALSPVELGLDGLVDVPVENIWRHVQQELNYYAIWKLNREKFHFFFFIVLEMSVVTIVNSVLISSTFSWLSNVIDLHIVLTKSKVNVYFETLVFRKLIRIVMLGKD